MITTDDVASPCIQVCRLDATDICIGCGRSLAEIAEWPQATRLRKQQICKTAQQRLLTSTETGPHDRHQA